MYEIQSQDSNVTQAPHSEPLEKFVAFFLGNVVCCASACDVVEVVHPSPIAVLPNAPRTLLGVFNYKGEILSVVNIKHILGFGEALPNSKTKVVVLRDQQSHVEFAIVVDSMHELISVEPGSVRYQHSISETSFPTVERDLTEYRLIEPTVLYKTLTISLSEA